MLQPPEPVGGQPDLHLTSSFRRPHDGARGTRHSSRRARARPRWQAAVSGGNTVTRAEGRGAAWTDERSLRGGKAVPSGRPEASGETQRAEGRGAAWTDERSLRGGKAVP